MAATRGEPGALSGPLSLLNLAWCVAVLLAVWPALASAQPAGQLPASLSARDPERLRWMQQAEQLLGTGRLDDAQALAATRPADDVAALTVRGRIATIRGKLDEAERLLSQAAGREPLGDAALQLGLVRLTAGRHEEAGTVLEPLVAAAARPLDVAGLVRAGRAAHALGQVRLANNLFRQASSAAADDAGVNIAWGELLLEKYNKPEALKSFRAALASAPDRAEAHLGLARTLADDNPPGASEAARKALEIDPTLVGAHVLLAELALDARRTADAKASLERALAINPSSLEARALVAAIAFLDGRTKDFDAEVARILAINPGYGDAYRVAGEHTARAYRFEDAVALIRKALEVDPSSSHAQADLGKQLLRVGDEDEARQWLDKAFQADPYDVATFNYLSLFDSLNEFETIEQGHFVIRLHPDEAPVMRDAVVSLANEAVTALSARYGFTPKGPLLVEMFAKHDDFAVRTVGLPGMIGALGACFGRVVSLDSPRARPPGSFNWAATLWHELAHVYTLQMSNQRVPRWVTEGTSVFEERRARPSWGRESEIAFVRRLLDAGAIPLKDLNSGFSDPHLISLAYYQASLVIEHIVQQFGEEALHRMLRAYGEGLEDEQVLTKALGVSRADLQTSFDAFLKTRFGAVVDALRVPAELGEKLAKADAGGARALAAQYPGAAAVQMTLGRLLVEAGDLEGATAAFERAVQLVPTMSGEESPQALLAEVLEKRGQPAAAAAVLEKVLGNDPTSLEQATALARVAAASGDRDRARVAYERIVEVQPFEAPAHAELGRLALARRDGAGAVRSFALAIAAGATDMVAARTDLAEAYLADNRPREAKREVIGALELAPRFERAQELLLRLVDGPQPQPERP